jgi:hypothetical protein
MIPQLDDLFCGDGILDDFRQNVGLAKDLDFMSVDFDFGAAIFSEDDFVADGDREFASFAAIEQFARPDGNAGAALWFFLGVSWEEDSTGGGLFGFHRFDNDAIIERADFDFGHGNSFLDILVL